MAGNVKIELGFVGGGSMAAAVSDKAWDDLKASLASGGDGWVEFPGLDDDVSMVAVDKIVFARAHTVSRPVGFTGVS